MKFGSFFYFQQVLPGSNPNVFHWCVVTTMIYTHVLKKGGRGVQNPADRI